MNTQAKYLKPKQKFRFKNDKRKVVNVFLLDDRLEYHYKNFEGVFSSGFYNDEVIILDEMNEAAYLVNKEFQEIRQEERDNVLTEKRTYKTEAKNRVLLKLNKEIKKLKSIIYYVEFA